MNNITGFLTKLSTVLLGCYVVPVSPGSNPASTNYLNSTLIGQEAYGGVVFFTYLSGGVVHGLVAASADELNTYQQTAAVTQCASKTNNGYSDWVLPNKAQISSLFNNRFAINPNDSNGGFRSQQTVTPATNSNYWSSTLKNDNYFYQNFYSGAQNQRSFLAAGEYYVRCIRSF